MMTRHSRVHRASFRLCAGAIGLTAVAGLTGCNTAGEGFLTGGTLGALGGMAIGSTAGHMGTGAVIGSVLGAIGGAVIGDQNARYSAPIHGVGYSDHGVGGPDGQWVYVGGGQQWQWCSGGQNWSR